MAGPPPNGVEGSPQIAHSGLLEFAAAAKAGNLLSPDTEFTEELDGIIREVAETGITNGYPWDALRQLLARKVEVVLGDFWRDVPDVQLQEGESFEGIVIEPLRLSLLEPRREGAPFTVQRLCELLVEPRLVYKSTRKFLYAVQRAILVSSTEEAVVAVHKFPEARFAEAIRTASAVAAASAAADVAEVPLDTAEDAATAAAPAEEAPPLATETVSTAVEVAAVAVAAAGPGGEPQANSGTSSPGSPGGSLAGRKRKLPPELSNGVVE